jgi:hypothetical protein
MAQQLEAALRRPPEQRAPAAEPPAPAATPAPRAPAYKLRVDPRLEPKFDAKPEPKFDAKPEPRFDPKPEPRLDSPAPATPGKNLYDNLEEEMASLLGRPSGKT